MPHIHDKIDFCVEVFVVHKNKVLLRKHDKHKIWLSVGGHIELNEDPNEAAIREVKEEVGLDVQLIHSTKFPIVHGDHRGLIPPVFISRIRMSETHEHVVFVYFAHSSTDKLTPSNKEISEECRWFTQTELEDQIFKLKKDVQVYAKAALATLER